MTSRRLVVRGLSGLYQIQGIAPPLAAEQDYPPVLRVDGVKCTLALVRERFVLYTENG